MGLSVHFLQILAVQDERGPRKKTKESSNTSQGENGPTKKDSMEENYSFLKSVSNRKYIHNCNKTSRGQREGGLTAHSKNFKIAIF